MTETEIKCLKITADLKDLVRMAEVQQIQEDMDCVMDLFDFLALQCITNRMGNCDGEIERRIYWREFKEKMKEKREEYKAYRKDYFDKKEKLEYEN